MCTPEFLDYSSSFVLIFHCLRINYKEIRYLADPKIPYLNSLGRDLIYHLWFFYQLICEFLDFSIWLIFFLSCQYRCFCWPIWIWDAVPFVYTQSVPRDIAECIENTTKTSYLFTVFIFTLQNPVHFSYI